MDVVEEFPASIRAELLPSAPVQGAGDVEAVAAEPLFQPTSSRSDGLSSEQKAIYDVLRIDQPMFVDSISGSVRLPQPRILAALLELEMSGLVRQLPGKNFVRKL